jgi:hypothetical protein
LKNSEGKYSYLQSGKKGWSKTTLLL